MGQAIRYYLTYVAVFAATRAVLGLAVFGDDPGWALVIESVGWAAFVAGFWLAFQWRNLRPTPDDGAAPGPGS